MLRKSLTDREKQIQRRKDSIRRKNVRKKKATNVSEQMDTVVEKVCSMNNLAKVRYDLSIFHHQSGRYSLAKCEREPWDTLLVPCHFTN